MALSNFIPELWSREVKMNRDKKLVAKAITNSNYIGDIKSAGDVVRVQGLSRVTVGDYTRYNTISYQAPTDTQETMTVDQQKYFAVQLDDLDRVQANVDVMGSLTRDAGYQIAKVVDTRILSHYTDVASSNIVDNAGAAIDLSASNIYGYLSSCVGRIADNDALTGAVNLIVSPDVLGVLVQAAEFTHATAKGDVVISDRFVGTAAGMNIYQSTNVPTVATSKGGTFTAAVNNGAGITAADTSIAYDGGGVSWQTLTTTAEYFVKIDNEYIKVRGVGGVTGTLTVIKRGALGSTAATHADNAVVTVYDVVAHGIAATSDFVTFADQFTKVEALRLETHFSDSVRGLYLYGSKVFHPESGVDFRYVYKGL